MMIDDTIKKQLIQEFAKVLSQHSEELTELDRAIGDGDHGLNMDRGFSAVADIADEISTLPLAVYLKKLGMTLVMKIGGASGPLYGSLFMGMAKAAPQSDLTLSNVSTMFAEGVAAVKSRGKSEAGEKTMLDVLVPVMQALAASPKEPFAEIRKIADEGLENTREMKATKGRASFLGDRSIGHIDPGARSSALLLHTACNVLEGLS